MTLSFKEAQAARTAHEQPPYSSTFDNDLPLTGRLLLNASAEQYILGGNATVTIVSVKTGNRYTYRIRRPDKAEDFWFVDVLKGSDNDKDFGYIGQIFQRGPLIRYQRGKKCWSSYFLASDVFLWAWKQITLATDPHVIASMEVWHSGKCGRCGRKLTVPESVATGFGPECINHV